MKIQACFQWNSYDEKEELRAQQLWRLFKVSYTNQLVPGFNYKIISRLTGKAMYFAHKTKDFAWHFVNIEVQSKAGVYWITCRLGNYLQWSKTGVKNILGNGDLLYFQHFIRDNYSTM